MKTIVSRAPTRISFLGGGGTDHPEFFNKYGGAIISTAINLNTVVSVHQGIGKLECISVENLRKNDIGADSLKRIVRKVCMKLDVSDDLIVFVASGLNSGAGLGTSSSLIVALVSSISQFYNINLNVEVLCNFAIEIERNFLEWHVGYQDQIAATYGGFNFIEFKNNSFKVSPLELSPKIKKKLFESMILLSLGKFRVSSKVEEDKLNNFDQKSQFLIEMKRMAYEGKEVLLDGDIVTFMKLIDESWLQKKQLSQMVSSVDIDNIINGVKAVGASCAKILGAGGGGTLLVMSENREVKINILNKFNKLNKIDFQLSEVGAECKKV